MTASHDAPTPTGASLGRQRRVVVGVVARGPIAIGVIALGGVSFGVVALGGVAVGVIALGAVSLGLVAVGGIAVGWRVLGALVLGGALAPLVGALVAWGPGKRRGTRLGGPASPSR